MLKKEYGICNKPSLNSARKRILNDSKIIKFEFPEKLIGIGNGKNYLVKTYGCQGNLADSEKISGLLEKLGFTPCESEATADLVIFNTCAIRENAENRIYGELGRIKKIKKVKPDMIIGICGCMMQEESTITMIQKKYPHVDLIFGTHNITKLPEYIEHTLNNRKVIDVLSVEGDIYEDVPVIRDHPYKAWVNIMYGCDEFCTYCIVPYTRGRERSRMPEDIIKEVKELAENGYKEVTLLGQNVNAYGKDLGINYGFADLLTDLNKIKIDRIRFTTSHPRDFDDATIDAMALGGNIMPHLHLPVQSGNDEVLKRMNRKYTSGEYIEKMKKLKERVLGISITTDIIVAFPGETEEQFQDTIKLVKEIEYEGAYTFIYSPREGTPAAKYPNPLTEEEKKQRLLTLNEVINEYTNKGHKRFENEIVEVLVDGKSKSSEEMYTGYTKHNMLVNFEGTDDLIGTIVKVKVLKSFTWHLLGEIVK
ncbi:MAG: tRNA (N6-isopentenyl adenosine(37)-C2)-methylthiotransferase MiaB [Bacilli bacterium]|nr:tRNA (N6-isopentenyl adenosine(37)-C2)-methylthiotransferase MiaB [Bacilli bacterium]